MAARVTFPSFNPHALVECNDPATAYSTFARTIIGLYESSFPFSSVPHRSDKSKLPWFTRELKLLFRRKNKHFVIFRKHPTLFNELQYKVTKRIARQTLRQAEIDYYHSQITENRHNMRRSWQIINELIGKPNKRLSVPFRKR